MTGPPRVPVANAASTLSTSSVRMITCTRSPSCRTVSAVGSIASPSRVRNATRTPVSSWSLRIRWPIHAADVGTSASCTPPLGSRHSGSRPGRQQPAQHLVGGPAHGRDGGDAQALVDLGAARVVDPGRDVLDAEHLPGHPGGDDVGVVAAADRGEGARLLDAGLAQGVLVEADTGHPPTGEAGAQTSEGRRVLVDDGDRVTSLFEGLRESGAHSPAAHDYDVHACPSG